MGQGRRLFDGDGDGSQAGLRLAGCEALGSGVVHLTYHPAEQR